MRMTRLFCVRRAGLVLVTCFVIGQFVWFLADQNSNKVITSSTLRQNQSTVKVGPTSQPTNSSGIPILLWWDSVYTNVDEVRQCGELKCRVTNLRSLKNDRNTVVFLFYASHFKPYDLPLPRGKSHLWALFHEESPRNAYIFSHHPALSIFNFTSTYSRRSDYPITTQWLQCPDWIHETQYVLPLVDKNRLRDLGLAPVLYLQSDCDVPSDRDNFVKLLQTFIPVDSYGTCLQNKKMADRLRFRGSMAPMEDKHFFQFAARYKFTLAMENYVCEDYVTEKLWRPLRVGSVPVVFGAPNVREYLPSNKSAIIMEDFSDVEDLADFLRLLDSRDDLYKEYLEYKRQPIQNDNLRQILESRNWAPSSCLKDKLGGKHNKNNVVYESIFSGYECYLCEKAHAYLKSNKKTRFQVHDGAYGCPSPRKFDSNGRYSVHSDTWSSEWRYGKFEAEAMIRIYKSNLKTTKKEFHKLVKRIINENVS